MVIAFGFRSCVSLTDVKKTAINAKHEHVIYEFLLGNPVKRYFVCNLFSQTVK
ncbi:hypothetical protein SEHO0A_01355 [Salmonella enterica subsp. houtenae str. ATCC BAA-1581]|nr:hypothetical protein SEHO0A_01355 [Salmonella enterica subsp. houtenae str. ATCC BAA-1581]